MIVLVLEPDPARAESLGRAVAAAGATPVVAANADDVRRAAAAAPVDVAIVTATTPADAVTAARGDGFPVVLLADGRDVPAHVLDASPVAVVSASVPAAELAGRLAAAAARPTAVAFTRLSDVAIEAALGAIVVTGADGVIRGVNGAFARVAGGALREPAGVPLDSVLIPEGDAAATARFLEAVRGHGDWVGDATLLAGGAGVAVRAGIGPLARGAAGAAGAVTVLLDLTDHRALEASLREANRVLERQAFLDPLTGLWNRAYLHDALEREVSRARRYSSPLAVLMIDLDGFKRVNDAWGHGAGDEALRAVADALRSGLREGDVLARYGGDEFCALLPNTDHDDARLAADRIRDRVRALSVGADGSLRLGASVGVGTTADLDPTHAPEILVRLADRALLAAKRGGGDRVLDASSVEARSIAWTDLGHGRDS